MTAATPALPVMPASISAPSGRRLGHTATVALLAPLLVLITVAFAVPVLGTLKQGVLDPEPTLRNFQDAIEQPLYLRIILRTLWISVVVSIGTLLLGYPVAYLMARSGGTWATVLAGCIMLPLWTSVLARSYAWTVLLSRNGVINSTLGSLGLIEAPLRLLYTEGAVIVAMVHVLLPFMVLPLYAVIRTIPPELERAAFGLGASEASVFVRITLPLPLPGAVAGFVMVLILSLGFYVTPALVGGAQTMMVAQLIAQEIGEARWGLGAALATILLACTLALLACFGRFLRFGLPVWTGD